MNLESSVRDIKGVGDKSFELFLKLGLKNVDDLLHFYPRAYDKYEKVAKICEAEKGSRVAIEATVKNTPKLMKFKGKSIVSFFISDSDSTVEVRFFNAPFMAKAFKPGDKKVFRGYFRAVGDRLILDQPKAYSVSDYELLEETIVPIYSLTKDLTNEKVRKCVRQILDFTDEYKDYLTDAECKEMSIMLMQDALKAIHFPADEEALYLARRRIVFGEFLNFVRISKEGLEENKDIVSEYPMIEVADCKRLIDNLPYELTNAQKKAVNDITTDLTGKFLMNRLVQGDVGSGKTIVAIIALLMCAANGYQGAMMAPTEVLARQHYENIKRLVSQYNLCIKPILLTGKMSAKDRREALAEIASGEANVILGTHALIQDKVEYKKLALVITDEQHRFGVKQREAFKDKGNEPHLLVMSATPIPRTLAMIVFAGLSVSVIDELPKNRIPILNCVVDSSYRNKAYEKIRSEIAAGHQAYVICPMVYENDSEDGGLKSVEQHSKDIKEYFGDAYRVGTLNGKMKPEEKSNIMENFKEHNIDILVSTTVIEVGIDVPNATVILIENAERFGLSQLHQLRGRVGRGAFSSYCILMTDTKNKETLKRLKVLNETNDGFVIAKEDMKMRGPGELDGVSQSGELQFGLGNITSDGDLLMLASDKYNDIKDRLPLFDRNLIDFRTI